MFFLFKGDGSCGDFPNFTSSRKSHEAATWLGNILDQNNNKGGRLGSGNSNIFGKCHPYLGKIFRFDEHIFQMGWNHPTRRRFCKQDRRLCKKNSWQSTYFNRGFNIPWFSHGSHITSLFDVEIMISHSKETFISKTMGPKATFSRVESSKNYQPWHKLSKFFF